MGRPYYSKIAAAWHQATGASGGPFKKYVLNDFLIEAIGDISELAILELGAGNGYFMPRLLRRNSGRMAARVVVSDLSGKILALAQKDFPVSDAEYCQLDVRNRFPFEDNAFDLIIATMIFNEVSQAGLKSALAECARVLKPSGRLLATIMHPDFVDNLQRQGKLSRLGPEFYTMPGAGSLRLPVVPRTLAQYERLFENGGFSFTSTPLFPSEKVHNERPGLRYARDLPLALVFDCAKIE